MNPFQNFSQSDFEVLPCGCWEWLNKRTAHGYGVQKGKLAHREAYEDVVGPIPEGFQVDHVCNMPSCINPAHLEAVSGSVNLLRKRIRNRLNPWATHCMRGHVMDDMNTLWRANGSGRQCRTCQRERMSEAQVRRGGKPMKPKVFTRNPNLKYKHLYLVTGEMLSEACIGEAWLAIHKTCNHGSTASVGITNGKPKSSGYKG